MKPRLVIFAKTPRLGQGKRRLAAGIGLVPAWRFQRLALDRVVRRLARDRRWECWLAVAGGPARICIQIKSTSDITSTIAGPS